MFKSTELPILIQFLVMFYNYKPGDQLLDHIAETQMCRLEDRVRCSLTSWLDYRSFVFLYQALRHLLLGIENIAPDNMVRLGWVGSKRDPGTSCTGGQLLGTSCLGTSCQGTN